MRICSYAAVLVLLLLLVGCGGGGSGDDGGGGVTGGGTKPSRTDSNQQWTNATEVVKRLQDAGVPIDDVQELTAENDSNELLGRPGQYTGKALFHDSRLPKKQDVTEPELLDTDGGGSVEVFANEADAKRRADYVQAITSSGGLFAEYSYLHGTAFVRVTASLTPDQAKAYERAAEGLE